MSPAAQRFQRLKSAFGDCVELGDDARAAHLAALSAHDPTLADDLRALLATFDRDDLVPATPRDTSRRYGPFRTQRKLGDGGMGEVFLAAREGGDFAQLVALKVVRFGGLSPELTRRFLRERQILARLEHPGIARLIDGGVTDDGEPWLAMEYVDGERLGDWCARAAPDVRERVQCFRAICEAVAFAHGNLIVHRDIKPANIMIGRDGAPRLLDFGIAKLVDDSDVDATQTGLRALTLRYAAPEQIAGERTTTATDVYALGVVLFELLTGASPYARAAAGVESWTHAVLHESPRALADALPDTADATHRRALRGDLDRIVRHAMAKRPQDRYASVAALSDDLADWLGGAALRSGIGGARAQTRALLRRYRWPLASALAIALALAIGAVVALQQAREAQRQATVARENLDALLGVLDQAVPDVFTGREQSARELLVAAETYLRETPHANDTLRRRALTRIGLALLNSGHARDAERALGHAVAAMVRENPNDTATALELLRLLALSQTEPDAVARARLTSRAIAAYAHRPDAVPAHAINAIGSVAGALSRGDDFDGARQALAFGETFLAGRGQDAMDPAALENWWRQKGWVALRAAEYGAATDAFASGAAVMDAAPDAFGAMRRAELDTLRADAATAGGDGAAATAHLARAAPHILSEYPVGHSERDAFELLRAEAELARGNAAGALEIAGATQPQHEGVRRVVVVATALATLGFCDASRAMIASQAVVVDASRLRMRDRQRVAAMHAAANGCRPTAPTE